MENTEELLAQAKLKYPKGTKFKYPIEDFENEVSVVVNPNFFMGNNGNIFCSNKFDDEPVDNIDGCVYHKGRWAEIIL